MPPPHGRRPPPPPPGSNVDAPPPLPGGRDAIPRKPSRQEETPPQLPPPRRPTAQQESEEDIGQDYEVPSQELFNKSQNKSQILAPEHRPFLPPRNEVQSYDDEMDTWSDEFSDVEEEPEGAPSTDYEVAEGGMPAPPPMEPEPEGPDQTYEICGDQEAIKPQPAPPKKNSIVSALTNKFKSIGVMGGPGSKEAKVAKVKPNIKGRKQSTPGIDEPEILTASEKTIEQPSFSKPPTPSKPTVSSKPEKPAPPTKPNFKPLKPTHEADPKKNSASTSPDRKKSINSSEDNVSNGSSGSGGQVSRALPSRPWEVTSPNNSNAKVFVLPVLPPSARKNSEDKPKAFVSPQSRPTQPLPAYPDNDPDEIYDDAVSQHMLSHYEWFHMTDRKGGEALLRKLAVNGGYLVRESSKVGFFTLMIYIDGNFKNMNIRCRDSDQMYAIGKEKAEEVAFPSVAGLIEYHQKHHLTVVDGASVKLNATPPKLR